MSYRFASPELLRLGPPPPLAAKDFETLNAQSMDDLIARFNAVGISYDVQNLETAPAVILTQSAAYRDMLRRQAIDDAVAQTYLGSATGEHLDQRAADYGVVRRVVQYEDAYSGTPEIREDDDSLRIRAHLAWEALSVAGPLGAYVFHALDAHPGVFDALAYGPESGHVEAGEVLVVIQSRAANGLATTGMVDAVAERLDAREVRHGRVEAVSIEDGGEDYEVGDVISATGGGGSGFAATVSAVDGDGAITAVAITSGGVGYTSGPALAVASAAGTGAVLTANIFVLRTVGARQSVRPLGARVTVVAAQPLIYTTTATLYVSGDGDREAIRRAALTNLTSYQESRKRVGRRVPKSGLEAALALVAPNGVPVVDDVDVDEADVVPSHLQVPVPGAINIQTVVR